MTLSSPRLNWTVCIGECVYIRLGEFFLTHQQHRTIKEELNFLFYIGQQLGTVATVCVWCHDIVCSTWWFVHLGGPKL